MTRERSLRERVGGGVGREYNKILKDNDVFLFLKKKSILCFVFYCCLHFSPLKAKDLY